jgi:hypothetical protein
MANITDASACYGASCLAGEPGEAEPPAAAHVGSDRPLCPRDILLQACRLLCPVPRDVDTRAMQA